MLFLLNLLGILVTKCEHCCIYVGGEAHYGCIANNQEEQSDMEYAIRICMDLHKHHAKG